MSTYTKNGHIHGYFNSERHSKFEHIGRCAVTKFWQSKGWTVCVNDLDQDGEVVKNRADLVIELNKKQILMEAATKRSDLFKYIESGVDVLCKINIFLQHLYLYPPIILRNLSFSSSVPIEK